MLKDQTVYASTLKYDFYKRFTVQRKGRSKADFFLEFREKIYLFQGQLSWGKLQGYHRIHLLCEYKLKI